MEKKSLIKTPKKLTGVANITCKKIDLKPILIKRDGEEGHFTLINGKIHQEDISIQHILGPKCKSPHIFKRNITKA